jgi:hypothetical protein
MNMKYVYLCSECETVWKTNEQTWNPLLKNL